jgi:predicted ATPase
MINRVHFENFKSLQNVSIDLGRFTALVGPNGCGKSSVLQATHLLAQIGIKSSADGLDNPGDPNTWSEFQRLGAIFDGRRSPARLIHRGRAGTIILDTRRTDGDELKLTIHVGQQSPGHLVTAAFVVGFGSGTRTEVVIPPADAVTAGWEQVYAFLNSDRVTKFASTAYLRLDVNEMVQTAVAEDEIPRMGSDGSQLASTLAWMKGAAEDELAQITVDLRRIVPGVKRIRTFREKVSTRRLESLNIDGQPVWRPVDASSLGDRFAIEFDDGSEVPADLLSEGTVLALGLLTTLREPGRPRLFLLDDIDRGLHLGAQVKLVQVLRELMTLDPELQIVCTTHSPYLLDLFQPSEVRVLALDADRRTHVRPLVEHPEFDKWKFGTQTGELWAALGENWVLEGAGG